jgi:hypothetical protein
LELAVVVPKTVPADFVNISSELAAVHQLNAERLTVVLSVYD